MVDVSFLISSFYLLFSGIENYFSKYIYVFVELKGGNISLYNKA